MLEPLLIKYLFYIQKKYEYIQKIKYNSYRENYLAINDIKKIIQKEKQLNSNLHNKIKKIDILFNEKIDKTLTRPIIENLKQRRKILKNQEKTLEKLNGFNILAAKIESIFYKDTRFFEKQMRLFNYHYNEEKILNDRLKIIIENAKFPEELTRKRNAIIESYRTILLVNKELKILAKEMTLGNINIIREQARKILLELNKLKKTELYLYMKSDIEEVIKQLKEIIRNPKQNKLKLFLVGAHLIVPFTVERTLLIMLYRYFKKRKARALRLK